MIRKRKKKENISLPEAVASCIWLTFTLIAIPLFFYQIYHTDEAINSLIVTLHKEGYSKKKFEIYGYEYLGVNSMRDTPESEFWGKICGKKGTETMSGFVQGYMPTEIIELIINLRKTVNSEAHVIIDVWYNPDITMDLRFGYETMRVVPYFKGFLEIREKMLRHYCFRWIAFFFVLVLIYFSDKLNKHYEQKTRNMILK